MCKSMPASEGVESPSKTSDVTNNRNEMSLEDQLATVEEKLKRTTKYLHEIKALGPACEESGAGQEDLKERQVFVRRILQISAELQDTRDVLHAACQPRLTARQYDLLTATTTGDNLLVDDPFHDPSVRFFGMDWQMIFGKCFSLSLNTQIFRTQILDPDLPVDLVLLNSILKDLSRIEVDVTSHGEAVLNGRLSKSQQRLIQQEQSRVASIAAATNNVNNTSSSSGTKVSKSLSFRDPSGSARKQRQINKYKKNKTTDLHKLSASTSANNNLSGASATSATNSAASAAGTSNSSAVSAANNANAAAVSSEWQEVMQPKRKSSFIQNVSSIFKNIR